MKYYVSSDEVGWGGLCGPLVVVACRSPEDWKMDGLKDSKQLTPEQREELRIQILQEVDKGIIAYHLAERSNKQIDEMGPWNALKDAHLEALKALYQEEDRVIVDGGNLKFTDMGVDYMAIENLVKADSKIPACMSASILAKTYRDSIMIELAKQYPQYGWDTNMGYYKADHIAAIEKYGITELHRKSYKPVKTMIENKTAFYNQQILTTLNLPEEK